MNNVWQEEKKPVSAFRRRLGMALAFAGSVCAVLTLMLFGFEFAALKGNVYVELQEKYAVNEDVTGVSDDTRREIDVALAEYLAGRRESCNIPAVVYGEEQPAFNDTEISHMEDVRGLFDLERILRNILLAATCLLLIPAPFVMRDGAFSSYRRTYTGALVLIALVLGAFAFYVSRDFNRAFIAFHETMFSNDLWILNPETDLLIRLLPESFFADMAGRIALYMGLFAVAPVALLAMPIHFFDGKDEEDTDELRDENARKGTGAHR